ncbi:hypothetical protein NVP1091O_55 [Vibrio phage 1.091.O._10N.286.52.B12]|nr:hypothetical protein NVP1091O_55 [Vibrio phage 1.091.O._10N.286.52.B12]
MKNKDEMIAWLKSQNMDFDEFGVSNERHGWRFVWGAFEPYLENLSLKGQGLVGTSIYESDLQ